MKEQIKEIAKVLCEKYDTEHCKVCDHHGRCMVRLDAEWIYDAGYRKQNEVAREIFEEIDKRLEALLKFYPLGGEVTDAKKFVDVHWKHIRHSIMCDYDVELKKKYTEDQT